MVDNIKLIVLVDVIGQFLDQNVVELLQCLLGFLIECDQGEGCFVGICGIDLNLNNVIINGLNILFLEVGVCLVVLDVILLEFI